MPATCRLERWSHRVRPLDIFVALPTTPGGSLLSLAPIYEFLLARGFEPRGQFIHIEDWDVEFIPPATALVEEAIEQAVTRDVAGVPTRVFTAEHLAAISLQVGRLRDHARIERFAEAEVLDPAKFQEILRRHELLGHWQQLKERYPSLRL